MLLCDYTRGNSRSGRYIERARAIAWLPLLGHTSKKSDFFDLFRLPRNLGLKLSLDNKSWRKKNCKKMTTSISFLMSKLVKKYA